MKNEAVGREWEELESELFTKEEIEESNLRVAKMMEAIREKRKANKERC